MLNTEAQHYSVTEHLTALLVLFGPPHIHYAETLLYQVNVKNNALYGTE